MRPAWFSGPTSGVMTAVVLHMRRGSSSAGRARPYPTGVPCPRRLRRRAGRSYGRGGLGDASSAAAVEALAAVRWPVATSMELTTLLHVQLSAALVTQASPGGYMKAGMAVVARQPMASLWEAAGAE